MAEMDPEATDRRSPFRTHTKNRDTVEMRLNVNGLQMKFELHKTCENTDDWHELHQF